LTGGLMALRMGLGADRFVAATNRNDVLPRYLETGRAGAREAVSTPSSAMDVGDPSNLERIRHLYGDDVSRLREDLSASSHGDDATRRTIARVHRQHGYTLDPHTAVGWRGLEEVLQGRPGAAGIVVSTAHPAKFRDVVEPLVDGPVSAPERWTAALEGEGRSVRMDPDPGALRELLLDRAG
ncbi:MAG: threonine synthase, partial [Gemmatimonadota bacterium]